MSPKLGVDERRMTLLKGGMILLTVFFVGALLVISIMPKETRLMGQIIVSIIAAIISGSFVVRKLAKTIEDRLWGYSTLSIIPLFLVVAFVFLFQYRQTDVLRYLSEREFVTCFFLALLPLPLSVGFLMYEILSYHYGKLKLQTTRLCGRILLLLSVLAYFLLLWNLFYSFFSFVMSMEYILIITGLVASLTFYVMTEKIRGFRELLRKIK